MAQTSPLQKPMKTASDESIPATGSEVSSAILSSGREDSLLEIAFQACQQPIVETADTKCLDRETKMNDDFAHNEVVRYRCDETFYGISDLESNEENQQPTDLKLLDSSQPEAINGREEKRDRTHSQTQESGKIVGNISLSDEDVNKMRNQQTDRSGGQWKCLSLGDDPLTTFTQTKWPLVGSDSQQAHGDFIHNNDCNPHQNPLMTRERVSRKRPGQRSKLSVRRKRDRQDPVVMNYMRECLDGKPGTSDVRQSVSFVQDRVNKYKENHEKRPPPISNTSRSRSSDLGVDSNANQKKGSTDAESKTSMTNNNVTVRRTDLDKMVNNFSGKLSHAIHKATSEEVNRLKRVISQSLKNTTRPVCTDTEVQVSECAKDVISKSKPNSTDTPNNSLNTQSQNSTSVWGDTWCKADEQNNRVEILSCGKENRVSERTMLDEELVKNSTETSYQENVQYQSQTKVESEEKSHLDKVEIFSDESEYELSEVKVKKYPKLRRRTGEIVYFHHHQNKNDIVNKEIRVRKEERRNCLESIECDNLGNDKTNMNVNDLLLCSDSLSKNFKRHQNNNHCDFRIGERTKYFEKVNLDIENNKHKECYISRNQLDNDRCPEKSCSDGNNDGLGLSWKVSTIKNLTSSEYNSIPTRSIDTPLVDTETHTSVPSHVNLISDAYNSDQTYNIKTPLNDKINHTINDKINPPLYETTNSQLNDNNNPPLIEKINPPPGDKINPPPCDKINPPLTDKINPPLNDCIKRLFDGELCKGTTIPRQNLCERDLTSCENDTLKKHKLINSKLGDDRHLRHYRRAINFLQSLTHPVQETSYACHLATRSSCDLADWSFSDPDDLEAEDVNINTNISISNSSDTRAISAVSNANDIFGTNYTYEIGDNKNMKSQKKYDKKMWTLKNNSYTLVSKKESIGKVKDRPTTPLNRCQEADFVVKNPVKPSQSASKNNRVKNAKMQNLENIKKGINKKIGCKKYVCTSPVRKETEKKTVQNNTKPPLPKRKTSSKYGLNYCSPYRSPYRSPQINLEIMDSKQSILRADVKNNETTSRSHLQKQKPSKCKLTEQKKPRVSNDNQEAIRLPNNYSCQTRQTPSPEHCNECRKIKAAIEMLTSSHTNAKSELECQFGQKGPQLLTDQNNLPLPTTTLSSTSITHTKLKSRSSNDVTQMTSHDPGRQSGGKDLQLFPPHITTRGRYYPSKNVVCISVKPLNCNINRDKLEVQIRVVCDGKKSDSKHAVTSPGSPDRLLMHRRQTHQPISPNTVSDVKSRHVSNGKVKACARSNTFVRECRDL